MEDFILKPRAVIFTYLIAEQANPILIFLDITVMS